MTRSEENPPFSCSAGERKIMGHFVVKTILSSLVAALPRWVLRGEPSFPIVSDYPRTRDLFLFPPKRVTLTLDSDGNGDRTSPWLTYLIHLAARKSRRFWS
jgi:hypothetical protein